MRILLVGAGGVGDAIVKIAASRDFYDIIVVSDYDFSRAEKSIEWVRNKYGADKASKFLAAKIDASSAANVAELAKNHNITHVDATFQSPCHAGKHHALHAEALNQGCCCGGCGNFA